MVHTCPRCELRFTTSVELSDHLAIDHQAHDTAHVFERYNYEGQQRPGRVKGGRRYLVVANQTLHAGELIEHIRQVAGRGPATFYLLVPVEAHDRELGLAGFRLREMVDKLHVQGIDAEGRTGQADPYKAVAEVLEDESFDEIIVSTLPASLSKWLKADLAQRLQRLGVPVTTVTQSA